MLEIAQHYVSAYEARYKRSNFRNGRLRFSLIKDSAQIGAVDDTMFNLRLMFERYESIKNTFDLANDAPEWETIPFLKELKAAALLAGQFYLNVLKTPDLLCAVSEKENPTQIIALLPVRALSKRAISCFDSNEIRLNDRYVIVARAEKAFNRARTRTLITRPHLLLTRSMCAGSGWTKCWRHIICSLANSDRVCLILQPRTSCTCQNFRGQF